MNTMSQQAEFVARFEAAWNAGTSEALGSLLHEEVCLVQPLARIHGREVAVHALGNFLAVMPRPRICIHRWTATDQTVFIEFSLQGAVGRCPIQLDVVDSVELVDGLIRGRTAYFNPAPLVLAVLTQPWLLWRLLRRSLAFRLSAKSRR